MNKPRSAISPTREENYAEWYQEVIKAADLAESSPVRGCMVIKPWGYRLWEKIQHYLDKKLRATGHKNAYFPLFIPLSYFEKEAQHVEGFAKECAVVTHHRLEEKGGKLVPAGELDEPLIVRPTSEMIIGASFAKWVESYRDLPLLINQWANVVRWEMRTRLFLRTAEFLWQEGHTAHATPKEAIDETLQILHIYHALCRDLLAMPVIMGAKGEQERFPGAVDTYTIEAMMQDRKAIQAGTSHFLGQNFAKSSHIKFRTESGETEYAWTTSWGVTTRLVGGLVMTHSDDDGLILPPKIAPSHLVIIPILHSEEAKGAVLPHIEKIKEQLQSLSFDGEPLEVEVDLRALRGGEKSWNWIKKGIPLRLEIGPRDIEKGLFPLFRRDRGHKEAKFVSAEELGNLVIQELHDMQKSLYEKALAFQKANTHVINTKSDFYSLMEGKGGFALAHWDRSHEVENKIKEELGVTIRCIPLEGDLSPGTCPFSGRASPSRVLFAKAY